MKKFTGVILNKNLVERQGISKKDEEDIASLHKTKHYIYELMNLTDDRDVLRKYAKLVQLVEYKLQSIWKFQLSEDYHGWFDVPKCSSDQMSEK